MPALKDDIAKIHADQDAKRADHKARETAEQNAVEKFFNEVARPAFEEFAATLRAAGRQVKTVIGGMYATIQVRRGNDFEFETKLERGNGSSIDTVTDSGRAGLSASATTQNVKAQHYTKDDVTTYLLREYRLATVK